ncbi:MAG: DUF5671 domain-containing protein [bacterium]
MDNTQENNISTYFALLQIISFITLLMIIFSFKNIGFDLIDTYISDPFFKTSKMFLSDLALPFLLVATPIFFIIRKKINALIKSGCENKRFFYFTILIFLIYGIVTLIILITNFFEGELLAKFILKSLTSTIIFGSIIWNQSYLLKKITN